ncbi:MAG: hypothetical protein ACYCSP_06115 [Acidobacteriaceae bacterium]
MTVDDAIKLFDEALGHAIQESDAIAKVVEQIHQSGMEIEDFNLTLHLILRARPREGVSDAEFLRKMHIAPDLTPEKRRRRFLPWPGKRRSLAVLFAILMLLPALTGCANVHVDLGCQSGAPTITNAPSHVIQKHPVCGLRK